MPDDPVHAAARSAAALCRLYGDAPLLTLGGVAQPCAIYPAPAIQRCDVESVVGSLEAADDPPPLRDEAYLRSLTERAAADDAAVFDGRIVVMRRLHIGDVLRVDGAVGSYFDLLAGPEAIADEWRRCVESGHADDPAAAWARLPLRRAAHQLAGDPLLSGVGRANGVGVSTEIRIATADGPRTLLAGVSPRKPAPHGRLHVIPAAMLEPDASIADTVMRELAEELFGCERPAHAGDADRWWLAVEPVANLLAMIDRGEAALELTGVTINLLNLRPEICTQLRVHGAHWLARWSPRIAPNWEIDGGVRMVHFDDEAAFADDLGGDLASLTPPAAGAIALALGKMGDSLAE